MAKIYYIDELHHESYGVICLDGKNILHLGDKRHLKCDERDLTEITNGLKELMKAINAI
jgi:hypothetical protein